MCACERTLPVRLYLVRHGQAKPKEVDPERGLTDLGRQEVQALAAFLRPLQLKVTQVWHSGKPRAAQTAEILAPALAGSPEVAQRKGLAPNDPPEAVEDQLASAGRGGLMIVGHMPLLGRLASALLAGGRAPDVVAFEQASLLCLERGDKGIWSIRWMVTPDLLPKQRP